MKQAIFTLAAVVSVLFTGCTSPSYNYRGEATQISEPALNTVVNAQVGEEMVKQGKFFQHDAIRLSQPIKIGMFGAYTLSPGDYSKTGEDAESEFYRPASGPGGGTVAKAALIDPWESIQLQKQKNKISVVTVFHAKVSAEATGVERVKRLSLADDSFQQTLIYSGKSGSKIRLGYREFSNNIARPAFNNDVEYDLGDSKIIGYKGARIEVIEATNEVIKYRVIQNFNLAKQ